MGEFAKEWADVISQVGIGGFAIYALVHVWKYLITQADQHRKDTAQQDKAHQNKLLEIEDRHQERMKALADAHRQEISALVNRNVDEHQHRWEMVVHLVQGTTEALKDMGIQPPDLTRNRKKTQKKD